VWEPSNAGQRLVKHVTVGTWLTSRCLALDGSHISTNVANFLWTSSAITSTAVGWPATGVHGRGEDRHTVAHMERTQLFSVLLRCPFHLSYSLPLFPWWGSGSEIYSVECNTRGTELRTEIYLALLNRHHKLPNIGEDKAQETLWFIALTKQWMRHHSPPSAKLQYLSSPLERFTTPQNTIQHRLKYINFRFCFPLPDFLGRGPLSLVRTIEELLEWKSSGSGLWNRD
jgi:hypothetical protein